jgi:hypothetical protein
MLIKNRGAAAALAVMIIGVAIGFSFFDRPHCYEKQCSHEGQHQESAVDNDSSGLFVSLGTWAGNSHDAIEALSAIASLIFAAGLVGFTFTLYLATARTADLTNEALRLGRDEFNATHRPRLVIRSIRLAIFEIGRPVAIEFTIVNTGDADAILLESNATIAIGPGLPDLPIYDGDRLFLLRSVFPSGRINPVTKIRDIPLMPNEYDAVYPKGYSSIYLFGFIRYEHGAGNIRTFAFCRRFERMERRFKVVDDPNYEYSD